MTIMQPIKWIVPFCDTRKRMKTGNTVAPPDLCTPMETTDPHLANVKLLMGFNGAHGATSGPGMTDESPAHHGTPTVIGTAQINTAQAVFGGSSLWLNGVGDRLNFPDSDDFNLSNRKWTVECRIYPLGFGGDYYHSTRLLISQWSKFYDLGWSFHLTDNCVSLTLSTTGYDNPRICQSPPMLSTNQWYAIAVDFDGVTYRLYVDGVMQSSSKATRTIYNSSYSLTIGANEDGIFPFYGFIDEVRLTLGVARYANNDCYHVKTTPFDRPASVPPVEVLDGLYPTSAFSMSRKLLSSWSGSYSSVTGGNTNWLDQAGQVRNLVIDTSLAPTSTTAGPNSRAALNFDGTSQYMAGLGPMTDLITVTGGYIIASFIPLRTNSNQVNIYDNDAVFCDLQGNMGVHIKTGSIVGYAWDGNVDVTTGVALSVSTPYVVEWWHTGGNLNMRINGGVIQTATSGSTILTGDTFRIGRVRTVGSNYFLGQIFELATFNNALDSTTRDAIMTNFKTWIGA